MRLWPELHVYHDREPRAAAMNMAVDEALLENVTAPSLRFYSWSKPALSFGYFGSFAEAEEEGAGRELVRRWTGGGSVPHGTDLTYSVILPAGGARPLPRSRVVYTEIHAAIGRALSPYLRVELAVAAAAKLSSSCFANPVVADVMLDGQKIAGAAQRRTRSGLLHQGSIQNAELTDLFPPAFACELCSNFERKEIPALVLERARDLAATKYGTEAWLRLR